MGFTRELSSDVALTVETVSQRAELCAEVMAGPEQSQEKVYDWVADRRLSSAAAFFIESADFIDDVDHRTSDELGGTDEIQDLALLVRKTVREYMEAREPKL